jgi:hypothetical protein
MKKYEQLKKSATDIYNASTQKIPIIERILKKTEFNDDDRAVLNMYLQAGYRIKSIRSMKEDILNHIGHSSTNHSGSTVSRSELEAIHAYVLGDQND